MYSPTARKPIFPCMSLFPLPSFLKGRVSAAQYEKWLNRRAVGLRSKDRERKRPYAFKSSIAIYKALIHLAVVNSGKYDPYTGEKLKWELIGTWVGARRKSSETPPEMFEGEYALMPTIDHRDPDALDFEICSWRVNSCKNFLTPEQFIDLCGRVAGHRLKGRRGRKPPRV